MALKTWLAFFRLLAVFCSFILGLAEAEASPGQSGDPRRSNPKAFTESRNSNTSVKKEVARRAIVQTPSIPLNNPHNTPLYNPFK